MQSQRNPALLLLALAALCGTATKSVIAATITVTSIADTGASTLRAALLGAHDGDTINFSVPTPAEISLTTGELAISNSVTIVGPGPGNLRVDGNAASRVFRIAPSNTVTISGLTITNGAGGNIGGGVLNDHSTLTVSNCAFTGNAAQFGGGIANDGRNAGSATLTLIDSTLGNNAAGGFGGGVYNVGDLGSAILIVTNCSLVGNAAGNSGGAIDNKNGTSGFAKLTVIASTIGSNSASQFGGGIHNNGESAGNVTMTVTGSMVISNTAHVGGGICNDGRESGSATGMVADCIIRGNGSRVSNALGGGIYNNGEFSGMVSLTVSNCTLSGNAADYSGGGIYNDGYGGGSTGILNVVNSTLAGNSSAYAGAIYNDGGNSGHARLTVTGSTIHNNSASFGLPSAGAIYNDGRGGSATLIMTNDTLSGNSASNSFSTGGIFNHGDNLPGSAILTLIASTISGNSDSNSFSDGGIYNNAATLQIGGTILNGGGAGSNLFASLGTVTSLGYNLSSDAGGGRLTNATDQINTNPMLGPLQDNGGPTFTHGLLANSPAIDKGNGFGLTTDQRGRLRPYDASGIANASGGDGSDIGAFEVQGSGNAPVYLMSAQKLAGGAFRFIFTNMPGAMFTVLNTTNIALPLTNWTALGAPTEISSGRFQFTDPQATNHPEGYYGVTSP